MLTPNSEWGGEGSLGCGIGYGYLHRIPAKKSQTGVQLQDPELGGQVDVTDGPGGNLTPGEGYSEVCVCVCLSLSLSLSHSLSLSLCLSFSLSLYISLCL